MPENLGYLTLPNKNLNGPSAKVLEDSILKPLGLARKDAWLCDLLPESRINPNQKRVIHNIYNPLIEKYSLNEVTVPEEKGVFCDERRRKEITEEILESKAETLILLGDIPIKQYLKYVADIDFKSLRDYSEKYGYGMPESIYIEGKHIEIIPLAHPRQIGGLGRSNSFWYNEHKKWEKILFEDFQSFLKIITVNSNINKPVGIFPGDTKSLIVNPQEQFYTDIINLKNIDLFIKIAEKKGYLSCDTTNMQYYIVFKDKIKEVSEL